MHPPEPIPPPAAGGGDDASPARAAAALTRELARYGVTGIYSTAADPGTAAARLASLARPASASLLGARAGEVTAPARCRWPG